MSDLRKDNLNKSTNLLDKDSTAYRVFGESGPYLIFVHGVGMSGEIWTPQVKHFFSNYRVITYDFLGHGQSPIPKKPPSIENYVEQLNSLVETINISNFSLVGHSMGALISVAFGLKYPEKITALISLNMVYKRSINAQSDVIERANLILKQGEINNIDQTLDRWFKNKTEYHQIQQIKKVHQLLTDVNPQGYGYAYKLFAESDRHFENKLSELSVPVLYLTGSDDPNSTPDMSSEMAHESPQGSFISIANEAHMMAYIAPEKINPVIEKFIKTNE
ncbi:MAG: alpha/beta hydrolase [Candidatus Thioglobus sp.]|nr:alpha/beta hydrolase [Candidatus Thioglobus sp.]MDG1956166.1 alpha/beta hydrolase [Candidatus Thioglobus sp.]